MITLPTITGRISIGLFCMLLLSCDWGRSAGVERKTVKISVAAFELPITAKRYAELSSALEKEFQRFGYVAMTKLVLADSISDLAAHNVAEKIANDKPDVAIAWSTGMAIAFKKSGSQQTVFTSRADPLVHGLIENWRRPGGNLTGVFVGDFAHRKRLELLQLQITRPRRRIAVVADDPWIVDARQFDFLDGAARKFGVELVYLTIEKARDMRTIVSPENQFDGYYIPVSKATVEFGEEIMNLIDRTGLPAISCSRELFQFGGSSAYFFDEDLVDRQVAVLARRVVMGEAAGEIAVELPAQYKFGLRSSQQTSSAKLESKRLLYLSELLQKQ